MHPWILPLALHPGVHEVGVIGWVTGVPVDEIDVVSLLFGAIAGGSTTGAMGLLGKTIWVGSAFAALVLGLSLLPAWVLSQSGRGSPTSVGESPEERLLTEEERREGGFSDDELRQVSRELVHRRATIR